MYQANKVPVMIQSVFVMVDHGQMLRSVADCDRVITKLQGIAPDHRLAYPKEMQTLREYEEMRADYASLVELYFS